eukprot:28267_1
MTQEQSQQIYQPMYLHNETVNEHTHQPFNRPPYQSIDQQYSPTYSNVFKNNNNANHHIHNGFTQISTNQPGQMYNYETSYISSNCNQHSLIGVQVDNSELQQIQPSKFSATYYQSDCNSHHVGNINNYNHNGYNHDRNIGSIGAEFAVNCNGLNTNHCHIGNIINNNIYVCEPPLHNELNNEFSNELIDID